MTGPQFDRNDPVGILGSSPELMQAVMRNRRPQIKDFMGQDIMYPEATNFGLTMPTLTSATDPDIIPLPLVPEKRGSESGDVPVVPPQPDSRVEKNVSPKKPKGNQNKTNKKTPPPDSNKVKDTALADALKKYAGATKTTDEFIKDADKLLDKYAPLDKKDTGRMHLTKFFLDMAARGAQGDKPLAAAATAAPGAFDEYIASEEKQKEKQAERDLLGVTLGLQDKRTADASRQAINLKIIESIMDSPEKIDQMKALMQPPYNLSQKDALDAVFRTERSPGFNVMLMEKAQELGFGNLGAMIGSSEFFEDRFKDEQFVKDFLPNIDPALVTEQDLAQISSLLGGSLSVADLQALVGSNR